MLQKIALFALLAVTPAPLFAQTQAQMNQEARSEYQKADAELNQVYARIQKEYAKEAEFLRKLRAAQRAWVTFRDAHVEALFPAANKQREYGTVYPLCRLQVLTELTKERTAQLNTWIKGVGEGDTCGGSRRAAAQPRGIAGVVVARRAADEPACGPRRL